MLDDKVTFDLGSGTTVTGTKCKNGGGYFLNFHGSTNSHLHEIYINDNYPDKGSWPFVVTELELDKEIARLKEAIAAQPNKRSYFMAFKFGCQERYVRKLIQALSQTKDHK